MTDEKKETWIDDPTTRRYALYTIFFLAGIAVTALYFSSLPQDPRVAYFTDHKQGGNLCNSVILGTGPSNAASCSAATPMTLENCGQNDSSIRIRAAAAACEQGGAAEIVNTFCYNKNASEQLGFHWDNQSLCNQSSFNQTVQQYILICQNWMNGTAYVVGG